MIGRVAGPPEGADNGPLRSSGTGLGAGIDSQGGGEHRGRHHAQSSRGRWVRASRDTVKGNERWRGWTAERSPDERSKRSRLETGRPCSGTASFRVSGCGSIRKGARSIWCRHGVLSAGQARRKAAGLIAGIKAGEETERAVSPPAKGPTLAKLGQRYMREHVVVRLRYAYGDPNG